MPPYPGITSAVGLLTTELRYDAVRTQFQVNGELDLDRLNGDLATVEAGITDQFRADGLERAEVAFERSGDLRYVGQGYELRVPFPAGEIGPEDAEDLFRQFHEQHRTEYGHVFEDSPIEIVNVRVAGVGRTPTIGAPRTPRGESLDAARVRTGRGTFRAAGGDLLEVENRVLSPRAPARRRDVLRPCRGPATRLDDGRSPRQHRVRGPGGQSDHHDRGFAVSEGPTKSRGTDDGGCTGRADSTTFVPPGIAVRAIPAGGPTVANEDSA